MQPTRPPEGNSGYGNVYDFPLSDSALLTSSGSSLSQNQSSAFHRKHRIAILIDGASLFYAALQLQIEIDYLKLLAHLKNDRPLLRAYFYTGIDRANDRQQGFLLWMRRNGYRVFTKDLITLPDGSRKANMDVEMAVDMLMLGNYCDTLVLLSGTGDLNYAVDALSYRGVKIELFSLRANTNEQLINLADRFIDLNDIKNLIRKTSDNSLDLQ
jgi:uncharacterized LabA/DUF88 family protein